MKNKNEKNLVNLDSLFYNQNPNWIKILLLTITTSLSITFIYSCFARIDEVITAFGELQPIGGEIPIKSPQAGLINQINVKEGDVVKKNQSLLVMNSEIKNEEKKQLIIEIESLKKSIQLQKRLVNSYEFLSLNGAVSEIDFLTTKNQLQELESDYLGKKTQVNSLNIELKKMNLRSPANGTVFNLIPTKKDYFTQSGEILLQIVPQSKLEAKVYLFNKDIGFVKENMSSEVRIDAFPFTEFGSIQGRLKSIGDDALPPDAKNLQPRFPAYISLENQFLLSDQKKYALKSGQSVTANLLVRNKPIISIIFEPFLKVLDGLKGIRTKN